VSYSNTNSGRIVSAMLSVHWQFGQMSGQSPANIWLQEATGSRICNYSRMFEAVWQRVLL